MFILPKKKKKKEKLVVLTRPKCRKQTRSMKDCQRNRLEQLQFDARKWLILL